MDLAAGGMAMIARMTVAGLRKMFQTLSSRVTDGPLGIFNIVRGGLNLVMLFSATPR